jgi:outer membrane protein OmpA-like peptidoglycan-associated protein
MKLSWVLNAVVMAALLAGLTFGTKGAVTAAAERLASGLTEEQAAAKPPVASLSEVGYCTEQLKGVLRRVLTECGLIGGGRRGCQPGEVRNVAQINDEDFNTLFKPLDKRAGVVLFDKAKEDLDDGGKAMIDKLWADRRGASYFFIVARASTDGSTELNRALSHKRANSVFFQIADRFKDPDLEKTVGLMWLGEEYAQLGKEFCTWQSSRPDQECTEEVLNRSTILSWIDCRL